MITNENIDKIELIPVVREFIERNSMNATKLIEGGEYSLALHRLPFVVEIKDALIENYLEITLSDLDSGLVITGSSALACSLESGLQNFEQLKINNFQDDPNKSLFLSSGEFKLDNLDSYLGAIDKMLPLLKNGLTGLADGSFCKGRDFSRSVLPINKNTKAKYLRLIGNIQKGNEAK